MPKRTKLLISRSYQSRFENVTDAVFVNCSTLTAEEAVQFRTTLRETGATVTVVKNSLAARIFKDMGYEFSESAFSGPTAVVFGDVDAVTTSKSVAEWSKKNGNKIAIKAGLLEGNTLDEAEAQQLPKMLSGDELRQVVVSAVAGPLIAMVGVTSGLLRELPGLLQAIADKKTEEGE